MAVCEIQNIDVLDLLLTTTHNTEVSNANLDNMRTPGIYWCSSITDNAPTGVTAGKLIVLTTTNSDYVTQILIPPYNMIYVRYRYYSGGWKWGAWTHGTTS